MSQNNPTQGYTWDEEDENSDVIQSIPDEVISIYEVYVKEDTELGSPELSLVSSNEKENDHHQPINETTLKATSQESGTDGAAVDADKLIESDSIDCQGPRKKSKAGERKLKPLSEIPFSQTNDENSTSTSQIIDKDDPRSRLHFVKYLKRDGKTIKIWECGICSKEFRHQYTLMRHLPTHTDERNFKCDACGKAFRQLSTLSQHKAIHSDARPYVCEYCKKTFNRVSTLISHRKTHSENKPHKCPVCGKGFHQKGNLRNHVFTHTNERPYKCESCGKGFNQMSNLVCHKVKAHAHTERMQYSCGICGKEFPRRFSLRSHEESKHGIKYRNSSLSQSGKNKGSKKNLRIIELSSEDSMETDDKENRDRNITNVDSFFVSKIQTKAMANAVARCQVPFALYKPIKGIPVLVKVNDAGENGHMLTPATPEDLRVNGTITSSEASYEEEKGQMKISVVATVTQKLESDGKFSFTVEPPDPDEDHVENFLVPKMDGDQQQQREVDKSIDDYEPEKDSGASMDDCNELLELAAQGGIQFVRATEDGRYEVMSNSEARDLMAANSHDVTILEGPEAEAISVMQATNTRTNNTTSLDDVIIGDSENQIMVLDAAGGQQKPIDAIEILDSGPISYFSSSKIDDFILGQRTGLESIPLPSEEDLMAPQDFSNLFHHQGDFSAPHMSLLPLQEAFPSFPKPARLTNEDFNLLGVENNYLEEARYKLHDFEDIIPDVQQAHLGQEFRTVGNSHRLDTGSLPSFADTKVLGPKYQEFEAASQYHDIKIFNNFDSGFRSNGYCPYNPEIIDGNCQMNGIRLFGKKIYDDYPENFDDKTEGNPQKNLSSRSLSILPDNSDDRQVDRSTSDQFLLQAGVLTDADFLSFDASPGSQLTKSFNLDSLPDLN